MSNSKSMYAVEMVNITKEFSGVMANKKINFKVARGSIHALIGENGAGKSTLLSILFGLQTPDEGYVKIKGKKVLVTSPLVANALGVGMVHQHFQLIKVFSALDNIILGAETTKFKQFLTKTRARHKIKSLCEKYNLKVNLNLIVEKATVGEQQRIEILKMLYRDVDILIFDEPTAVLTPQEIKGLLEIMRQFQKDGKTIIFITHKLHEVKQIADKATIIRKGEIVKTVDVSQTTIQEMATWMVGKKLVDIKNNSHLKKTKPILEIKNLTVMHRSQKGIYGLENASFSVHEGEIVAIAGLEGNGQAELVSAIIGMTKWSKGSIFFNKINLQGKSIQKRLTMGLSYIPEDRHKHGLLLDFPIRDNIVLSKISFPPYSQWGIINLASAQKQTTKIIGKFDVRGAFFGKALGKNLSGGNQQKVVIGREINNKHNLLVASQPTRGLDLGAIEFIHKTILEEKSKNKAILLVSYELDEILALADTIVVLSGGQITGIVDGKKATKAQIGLLMTKKGDKWKKTTNLN